MAHTFSMDLTRLDEEGTAVVVEYTYRPGQPAHYGSLTYPGHPAEGPEIEIVRVCLKDDEAEIQGTDAEVERWMDVIAETHEDNDYPDD